MLGFSTDYQKLADDTFVTHMKSMLGTRIEKHGHVYKIEPLDALFQIDVGDVEDTGHGGGCIAFVTLLIVLGPTGQTISELMMGIGVSKREALTFAVHDLVETVIPPVISMLTSHLNLPKITESREFKIDQNIWMAEQGELLSNAEHSVKSLLAEYSPLTLIEPFIKEALTNDSQFYWIKIYYAKMGAEAIGEVRINNAVHDAASAYLQSLNFPQKTPLMFRQFSTFSPMEE